MAHNDRLLEQVGAGFTLQWNKSAHWIVSGHWKGHAGGGEVLWKQTEVGYFLVSDFSPSDINTSFFHSCVYKQLSFKKLTRCFNSRYIFMFSRRLSITAHIQLNSSFSFSAEGIWVRNTHTHKGYILNIGKLWYFDVTLYTVCIWG